VQRTNPLATSQRVNPKQTGHNMNYYKGFSRSQPLTTVNVTPTWVGLMPAMLALISNPNSSPLAVEGVTAELMRLAEIGDSATQLHLVESM
jgi:hypothetical protein